MQPPISTEVPGPSFYLTVRQPVRPGVLLLAVVVAVGLVCAMIYATGHSGHARLGSGGGRSVAAGDAPEADDDDDPSKVDTIYLGDPADAPVPATASARRKGHVDTVHPFVVVRLPRFGEKVGLIPDNPTGRLLYDWLAAFNQANEAALGKVLPNDAPEPVVAAQMELRRQTGGFTLLSAKEVQPGLLVFRLRDQTPEGTEALGTLQMAPNSSPAAIASLSLRAVASPHRDGDTASSSSR